MRTLAPTCLAVLLVATAYAKPPPCPDGRYLVPGDPLTGLEQAAPMDVVWIAGGRVSIASGCGPTKVRLRGSGGAVKVRARWKSCAGLHGKARLTGVLLDQCRTLSATFVAKADGIVAPVLGSLGTCGDGLRDADGGEECDGDAGPCPGACHECACGGVVTTTTPAGTTNPSSTTTPGGSTTTSTTGGGGSTTSSSTMPGVTTSSTTTTTGIAGSDLLPIGWMSPGTAVAGGNLAIQFTVKNQGQATASAPWYDYLLLSTDYALGNDTAFATPERTTNVAAGAQYTVNEQAVFPQVPPGDYYLFLHTDGANAVAEANEPNNVGAFVLVTVVAPDLAPTAFSAPATGTAGAAVSVSWTVQNQGSSVAFVPWSDRVVFSTDATLDGGDTTLGTFARGANVAVNASYSETRSVTLPSVAPGTYYLFVRADALDQIYEGGGALETNNVRGPVAITVS